MSTAVAAAPPTTLPPSVDRVSPRPFAAAAPSASPPTSAPVSVYEPAAKRARSHGSPSDEHRGERAASAGQSSPGARPPAVPPLIKVKQEPGSPALSSARPRPKRLDLSSSLAAGRAPQTAQPSAPMRSRDSAGLHIHDVGLACLSPGFQTNDPSMREQLQRSMDVRDQQRMIIEARQKGGKPGSEHDAPRTQDTTLFGVSTGVRPPSTSKRKGPPPGLWIAAPHASSFAHDRVIQSAPLHQTFTGLRPGEYPSSRHAQHGPSGLGQTSHIHHHRPATHTNTRLPPISDVFAHDRLDASRHPSNNSPDHSSHSNLPPPVPSPKFAQHSQHPPLSARERFRSAEEAVQRLSGGRDDLMPKFVHYGGGVQPPTPPSPAPGSGGGHQQSAPGAQPPAPQPQHRPPPPHDPPRPDPRARTQSTNGRRRDRDEYERDNGSPPSAYTRSEPKRATFAVRGDADDDDWRAHMSNAEKRIEFLRLCERAWDLFHS